MVIAQPQELKYSEVVAELYPIYFLGKNGVMSRSILGKRFVCCALTIVYSIYNTVGRSIASIYDFGGIFTSALRAEVNMSPRVV